MILFVIHLLTGFNKLGLNYWANSTCLFLSSAMLAYVFYINSFRRVPSIGLLGDNKWGNYHLGYFVAISIGILWLVFNAGLAKFPINPKFSDVIPTMDYMIGEFISGRSPYSVNKGFGYPIASLYFPFVWMPLIIPKFLLIDLRYLLMFVVIIFLAIALTFRFYRNGFYLLALLLINVLIILIILFNASDFYSSMEWLIMIYYCILCLTFFSDNALIVSAAITLCILSRYSFLFWLPIYALVYFRQFGMRKTMKVVIITSILFSIFFLPFLFIEHPIQIGLVFKGYASAAIGEWYGQSWQAVNELPHQLFGNGKGMAGFWYFFSKGEIEQKVFIYQKLHIMINVLFSLFLFFVIYRSKRKSDALSPFFNR
ncbi:MAG: hypothetical protein IPK03_05685 [Bacteroidetes bacterium]|nr:hypothetical protein [Bacteroidota bacterium]